MDTLIAGYVALAALVIIAGVIFVCAWVVPGPDRSRDSLGSHWAGPKDPTIPIYREEP